MAKKTAATRERGAAPPSASSHPPASSASAAKGAARAAHTQRHPQRRAVLLLPSVRADTWLFLLWLSTWLMALLYYFSSVAPLPFADALVSLLQLFVDIGAHALSGSMAQADAKAFSLRLSPLAACLEAAACSPLALVGVAGTGSNSSSLGGGGGGGGECVRTCLQSDGTAMWAILLVFMAPLADVLVRVLTGVHYGLARLLGAGKEWRAAELLPRAVSVKLLGMMLPPLAGFAFWNAWRATLEHLPHEATPALWLVVAAYVACLCMMYLTFLVVATGGYSFLKGLTLISVSLGAAVFDFQDGHGSLAEVGGRGARIFAYSCILEQFIGLVLATLVAAVELLRALYKLLTGQWRHFLQLLRLPFCFAVTIVPLLAAQEWIAQQMADDFGYTLAPPA